MALATQDTVKLRPGAAGFEDGTPSFAAVAALGHGFRAIQRAGGFARIEQHTRALTRYLADSLSCLRHYNGAPVAELYGAHAGAGPLPPKQSHLQQQQQQQQFGKQQPLPPPLSQQQGPANDSSMGDTQEGGGSGSGSGCHGTGISVLSLPRHDALVGAACGQGPVVAFNLLRPDGSYVGYREVERLATLSGVRLRTGCVCNPGACAAALGLGAQEMIANHEAGHVCWDAHDIMNGKPTGVVRVSFGYPSTFSDAVAVLDVVRTFFLERPVEQPAAAAQQGHPGTGMAPNEQAGYAPNQQGGHPGTGTAPNEQGGDAPNQQGGHPSTGMRPPTSLQDSSSAPGCPVAAAGAASSAAAAAAAAPGIASAPTCGLPGQHGADEDGVMQLRGAHGPGRALGGVDTHLGLGGQVEAGACGAAQDGADSVPRRAVLSEIWVYPVKSCRGMRVRRWPLGPTGLLYDRDWAIVDAGSGAVLAQRKFPVLATIQPEVDLERGVLTLRAAGMPGTAVIPIGARSRAQDPSAGSSTSTSSSDPRTGSSVSGSSSSNGAGDSGMGMGISNGDRHSSTPGSAGIGSSSGGDRHSPTPGSAGIIISSSSSIEAGGSPTADSISPSHGGRPCATTSASQTSGEAQSRGTAKLCGVEACTHLEVVSSDAAAWLQAAIGIPCRLVRQIAGQRVQPGPRAAAGQTAQGREAQGRGAALGFANEGQFLVVNAASVEDLNKRLAQGAGDGRSPRADTALQVDAVRFRPNLVVGGAGLQPWVEDSWRGLLLGQHLELALLRPCSRCEMICIDQDTGRYTPPEPLLTLAKFRRKAGRIHFGMLMSYTSKAAEAVEEHVFVHERMEALCL